MGLYDGIKDALSTIQKADNIELYKQLLDLGQQALDMQEEINRLREENRVLKSKENVANRIVRHKGMYITLSDDIGEVRYCSHCWDNEQKLIQVKNLGAGDFFCPHCRNKDTFDDAPTYRSYIY